ncbi:MAG: calcium-binding protein [Paracoccaceae bacterium]
MDITYFGPSSNFLVQGFFDQGLGQFADFQLVTNGPGLVVFANPSTGWQVELSGTGLDATTLSGTVTAWSVRDDTGTVVATFSDLSWGAADMFDSFAALFNSGSISGYLALLNQAPITFDGSGAVDGIDFILPAVSQPVNVTGTDFGDHFFLGNGNDVVLTGAGNDTVDALGGNDRVLGGGGNDFLRGGDGQDRLVGDIGNDHLLGEAGRDTILGGSGDDVCQGGDGNDRILGGNDQDDLYGEDGDDVILGGTGRDTLTGGVGNDVLRGNGGFDTLLGGLGDDSMTGGAQADVLFGIAGNNTMEGGGGFDRLVSGIGDDLMTGNFNADIFVFEDGNGNDTITDFAATIAAEKIDLSGVSAITGLADLNLASATAGAATQVGADVVIDTGGGNSITLLNVTLSDLDGTDFIF